MNPGLRGQISAMQAYNRWGISKQVKNFPYLDLVRGFWEPSQKAMSAVQEISLQEPDKHTSQAGGARRKDNKCVVARSALESTWETLLVDLTAKFVHLRFIVDGARHVTVEGWKLIYPFVAIIIILLQPHCVPPSLQLQSPSPHSLGIPSIYDTSNILPIHQF